MVLISSERNAAHIRVLILINHVKHNLRSWIILNLEKLFLTSLTSDKWNIVQMHKCTNIQITYLTYHLIFLCFIRIFSMLNIYSFHAECCERIGNWTYHDILTCHIKHLLPQLSWIRKQFHVLHKIQLSFFLI